jgi:hypothetical protein
VVATLPGAAEATSTTCSTSAVCAEYINTFSGSSGGVAIHGEANGGIGVRGTSVANTGFYGASGSGVTTTPGVEGESTNNSGQDVGGGFGLAFLAGKPAPHYGVESFGSYAAIFGVTTGAGTSPTTAGVGVAGLDMASGADNAAVAGSSQYGTGGLFASGSSQPTLGYYGTYAVGLYGVAEPTTNGNAVGVVAESRQFPLIAGNPNNHTSVDLATSSDLIYASYNGGGNATYFYVTDSGNATVSGTLTTKNNTYARKGGSGALRTAYGAQTTTPQIEDIGEGRLVNGRAVVPIDPDLADSIDMRRAYHVFLTPDGDCKGLYVEQRSPGNFTVRELQGGRSNLTFEYRIVAKPIDVGGERLAHMAPETKPAGAPVPGRNVAMAAPLIESPEARLRQRLGPQGYAKAIADLSRRLTGK